MVESRICKYASLSPVGNFLVAGKGGSQQEEEEERSAVGMATLPGCLHGFNSGVKCKCYSLRAACHKSRLPLSSLNFTFPPSNSQADVLSITLLHFHEDFFFLFIRPYVHAAAVHVYSMHAPMCLMHPNQMTITEDTFLSD